MRMKGILLMMTRPLFIVFIVHAMDRGRRSYRDTNDTAFVGITRRKLDMAVNYVLGAVLSNEASISIPVIYVTL